MAGRVALIDGDILAFQAASKVETPVDWGDGLWTLHASMDEAMARLRGYVTELERETEADHIVMVLSSYGGDRWRNDILPSYKQNRKPTRKPVVYFPLREYIAEVWTTFEKPRLEGDDVLGILATHPKFMPDDEKVVLSIDKDLKTVPGLNINWTSARKSDDWTPREISTSRANLYWMRQTLTGDYTDGYKGIPGVGPKTAEKILPEEAPLEELWLCVKESFEENGLGGMALPTAQVARILRYEDYDFDREEVVPWTPPPVEIVE